MFSHHDRCCDKRRSKRVILFFSLASLWISMAVPFGEGAHHTHHANAIHTISFVQPLCMIPRVYKIKESTISTMASERRLKHLWDAPPLSSAHGKLFRRMNGAERKRWTDSAIACSFSNNADNNGNEYSQEMDINSNDLYLQASDDSSIQQFTTAQQGQHFHHQSSTAETLETKQHNQLEGYQNVNNATLASHQPIIQLKLQRRKKFHRQRQVQWVHWAGGILPHQKYSGILNYGVYRHWLQITPAASGSDNKLSLETAIPSLGKFPTSQMFSSHRSDIASSRITPPQIKPSHLKPIYIDDHIIVVHKPSGILSVPGPRRHECVTSLAYRYFGKSQTNHDADKIHCENYQYEKEDKEENQAQKTENEILWKSLDNTHNKPIDTMVVHRLDRDTSGVFLMARNDDALRQLHSDFKDKTKGGVSKRYEALVCGHWNNNVNELSSGDHSSVFLPSATDEGEIDLPLVRDIERPPFMRVATTETELQQQQQQQQEQKVPNVGKDEGFFRMVGKAAKPSLTTYRILAYEYLIDYCYDDIYDGDVNNNKPPQKNRKQPKFLPVTRVELQPITGRTHQLRVHCAAVGHPIVGDSIYGYQGEGAPGGGLADLNGILKVHGINQSDSDKAKETTIGASLELQRNIYNYWMKHHRKQMNQHEQEKRGFNVNTSNWKEDDEEDCMLCLHAQQLTIFHPFTGAPMMFESTPPF